MAMTANGIIARKNGDEDFLSHQNWITLEKLTQKYKCLVWSRKTYENVMRWKGFSNTLKNVQKIIVSRNKRVRLKEGYILSSSPIDAVKKASRLGFKTVILSGGGKLNSSFIKSKLIDEIIINIEPTVLGKGIRILSEDEFETRLKLIHIRKLPDNIMQLHYLVKK